MDFSDTYRKYYRLKDKANEKARELKQLRAQISNLKRTVEWKRYQKWLRFKYIQNSKTELGEWVSQCSVCETGKRLRFDGESYICANCYVSHTKCKCGQIAVVGGLCRDCYVGKDEPLTVEDFVHRQDGFVYPPLGKKVCPPPSKTAKHKIMAGFGRRVDREEA